MMMIVNDAIIAMLRRLFEVEVLSGEGVSDTAAAAKIAHDALIGKLKTRADYGRLFQWSRKYYRLHMDDVIDQAEQIAGAKLGPIRGQSGATKTAQTAQKQEVGANQGPIRGQSGANETAKRKVSPTPPSKENPPSYKENPPKGGQKKVSSPQPRMIKPTVDEVAAEFQARKGVKTWAGLQFDAEEEAVAFMAHHKTRGWKVGKAKIPMVSWPDAVTTWLKFLREDQRNGKRGKRERYSAGTDAYNRIHGITSKFLGPAGKA